MDFCTWHGGACSNQGASAISAQRIVVQTMGVTSVTTSTMTLWQKETKDEEIGI